MKLERDAELILLINLIINFNFYFTTLEIHTFNMPPKADEEMQQM